MFSYVWPIALVVLSNIVYQICTKSIPNDVSPFAALTVTYLVGSLSSFIIFLIAKGGETSIIKEFSKMNWAPYILGMVVVGLEVGFICAYKAGWQVSTASIVQSSFLAIALLIVGYLLYNEALTWNKLIGIVICAVGLVFINLK